jgi:hypothetical protein
VRPERHDIAAPELPPRVRWLGYRPASMPELTASGPVLVHFFDFAQLNSVRALPYVREWHERYQDIGLTILGIHSPRFPFTATRNALEFGIDRLAIAYPVAQDSSYAIWHDYGVTGWPSLFVWGPSGTLRYFHFGEGEYQATEEAIQEELRARDATVELPPPMEPLRPSDAPGALVAPPSEEVFPGGSRQEPWRASDEEPGLEVAYAAGGAFAAIDGTGALAVELDGEARTVDVAGPGLYELASHARHEEHRVTLRPDPELEIYAISFAAGVPGG